MAGISGNYEQYASGAEQVKSYNTDVSQFYQQAHMQMPKERLLRDEFVHQHKKNGLFERLYNGIKNITGFGLGSKKVEKLVTQAENGEIQEEQAREAIDKYRKSQVNSAQVLGDAASIAASAATFFGLRKVFKKEAAALMLDEGNFKKFADNLSKGMNQKSAKIVEKVLNIAKSNKKMTAALALIAGFAGMYAKVWTGKINRIGSSEFKTDKKDFNNLATKEDKAAYKEQKKLNKKARRRANRRNGISGLINGLMMPVTLVGGAIAGVPIYLAGNTLNRYFIGNSDEKDKSIKGYAENLKDNAVLNSALAIGAAIPLIKKGKFANVFDKNLKKSFDSLKNAKLKESGYDGNTIYKELEDIIMSDKSVSEILNGKFETPSWQEAEKLAKELMEKDAKLNKNTAFWEAYKSLDKSMDEKINALTKENIIAVKMKQISNSADGLAEALQENCPPTYTLEEAQKYINKKFNGKYTVTHSLGAGTIAETYLAKAADNKEYCIKILKKGISAEKIEQDRDKFIKIIEGLKDKTSDEKSLLIDNVKNLADGIKNEVNFEHEMKAAQELAPHTKVAKVVKGVEVNGDCYVMEKADGVSLKNFVKLNKLRMEKNQMELRIKNGTAKDWEKADLPRIEREIERIKEKTPNFEAITGISGNDAERILDEYQKVFVEQFYKIDKNGKVIHGDIHPGNIFIDMDAFKAGKRNFFTLIDTGNTVSMSKEQALRALKLSEIVNRASVPDIVDYVLEGAHMNGSGLTKAQAREKLIEEFNKLFFDSETKLRTVDNDSVLTLANNIMRKYKIVPNDNQLNYNKARQSAQNSFVKLQDNLIGKNLENFDFDNASKAQVGVKGAGLLKTLIGNSIKYKLMEKGQIKENLRHLSKIERAKYIKNPNLLDENSENYLKYKLKQRWSFYNDQFGQHV